MGLRSSDQEDIFGFREDEIGWFPGNCNQGILRRRLKNRPAACCQFQTIKVFSRPIELSQKLLYPFSPPKTPEDPDAPFSDDDDDNNRACRMK